MVSALEVSTRFSTRQRQNNSQETETKDTSQCQLLVSRQFEAPNDGKWKQENDEVRQDIGHAVHETCPANRLTVAMDVLLPRGLDRNARKDLNEYLADLPGGYDRHDTNVYHLEHPPACFANDPVELEE